MTEETLKLFHNLQSLTKKQQKDFSEYFNSNYLFELVKNIQKFSNPEFDFFFQILTEEKFQIDRKFLNSMLDKIEDPSSKISNLSEKINENFDKWKIILILPAEENFLNIFEFLLTVIKKQSENLLIRILEAECHQGINFLRRILAKSENLESFKELREKTLKFYPEKELLSKGGFCNNSFFHYLAIYCENPEVLATAYQQIVKFHESDENLRKFLLSTNNSEENALRSSITWKNENSFPFLFEIYLKFFNFTELCQQTNQNGYNLLQVISQSTSLLIMEISLKKLKSENLWNFLNVKGVNEHNILHLAALGNKNQDSFNFLINFIKTELGEEKLRKMLTEFTTQKWIPLHCAVLCNTPQIFTFFFSIYEKNFERKEIEGFLNKLDVFSLNLYQMGRKMGWYKKEMSEILDKNLRGYIFNRKMIFEDFE